MIAPAAVGLSAVLPHMLLGHGRMTLLPGAMIAAFGVGAVPGWTAGPLIHLWLARRDYGKAWQYGLAGVLLGLVTLALFGTPLLIELYRFDYGPWRFLPAILSAAWGGGVGGLTFWFFGVRPAPGSA